MSNLLYIPVHRTINGGVPAGTLLTNAWTYTVPAGSKTEIEYLFLRTELQAAAAAGTANSRIEVLSVAYGNIAVLAALVSMAVVGPNLLSIPCYPITLYAGDILNAFYVNASAVVVNVTISAVLREYR
jgi:hypothetical protein